jgi:hypothetical protein
VTATTAKGKKLPGLVRRRQEEAALMLTGDYAGVKVSAEPVADVPSPIIIIPNPISQPEKPASSGGWAAFWEAVIALFNRKSS